ncbi:hypothetical protein AVEN_154510-1 [Araneus ventricosus]|uniref:Uncharacterized protein n=1 Tax=Araneus ventricosus TaxID=182803 RepID=A0A4Y2HX41_ARAVE|nr:hypothetical protein AVEN_154510-1 [Araneus ventricosus]
MRVQRISCEVLRFKDIEEFTETAVVCSPNRRKVSGRRGAAFGCNNSRAICVPASTETPEVPSGQAQLAVEHQTDNILCQADMGLYDGLVGIMLSNEGNLFNKTLIFFE